MPKLIIYHGDMRTVLEDFPDNHFTHVLTDPPYHLQGTHEAQHFGKSGSGRAFGRTNAEKKARSGFMGKQWDGGDISFDSMTWKRILRVVKPGGYMMCFGGSRTVHRIACAIEDAGWQLVDQLLYLYASGFPKALDVSKAIDKRLGMEREIVGISTQGAGNSDKNTIDFNTSRRAGGGAIFSITSPAFPEAKRFDGYRSQLAPAYEPIILAMKPIDTTFAENALQWGVAGLNIDAGRIPIEGESPTAMQKTYGFAMNNEKARDSEARGKLRDRTGPEKKSMPNPSDDLGRYPKNVILDGSDEVMAGMPETGTSIRPNMAFQRSGDSSWFVGMTPTIAYRHADSGSASRFFYSAKASPAERGHDNNHPTVKPLALLDYLLKLLSPPGGGLLLDPFLGSGSTLIACARLGYNGIGIEMEAEYVALAEKRIYDDAPMLNEVSVIERGGG